MRKLSHAYLLSIWLFLLLISPCTAQQKIRTVEKEQAYPNQPIEIVSRELGDKPFMDDARVLGDQDWLKHLTLSIENISNKNIIAFDIDLLIEKQGKMLTNVSFPIFFRTYTKSTAENAQTPQGDKKIGVLQPGEVVKVKVSDRNMLVFGEILKKFEAEDLDRVKVEIREVYFDDGTRWGFGQEVPAKRSTLSHGFSELIKYLIPIDLGLSSGDSFGLIFPASSRFFLHNATAKVAAP